jgi:Protocatechuate 3,4-dioxygenase beta subunit N terminal
VEAASEPVASQADITAEIARIAAEHQRAGTGQAPQLLDYPPYRSSALRHPENPLLVVDPEEVERCAPCFGADLTARHAGEPIGERIIVTGQVLDGSGKPGPYPWHHAPGVASRRRIAPHGPCACDSASARQGKALGSDGDLDADPR